MDSDRYYCPPEPTGEWEGLAFCDECGDFTMNHFVEWKWPGHNVSRECGECRTVFEVEDERDE